MWEPWMGGNRNDSLLYPGIIIGFDQCDAFGPLENSRVVEFSIHKTFAQLYFLGLDVFLIHTGELERKLIEDGVPFEMDEGYLAIPSMGLEFVTGLDDTIDEVNFWKLMHP